MAHIKLNNEQLPGIIGLFDFSPATAGPLCELAEMLLADDNNSLSKGEREIIAASVSYKNDCHFCHSSHGAAAAAHLNEDVHFLDEIKKEFPLYKISNKVRALMVIAHHVQQGGKKVTGEDIDNARSHGATDKEIHDAVLIAAAFCMYNRYVDGLATWAPVENEAFMPMGKKLAEEGYLAAVPVS
jgi:uncharacterized peroxidase-related enzyme